MFKELGDLILIFNGLYDTFKQISLIKTCSHTLHKKHVTVKTKFLIYVGDKINLFESFF